MTECITYDEWESYVSVGGTGSATTLELSEDEKKQLEQKEEKKLPFGFGLITQ